MEKTEIIKKFEEFKSEHPEEQVRSLWAAQSSIFNNFWHNTILNKSVKDINESDMDPIIQILDLNAKGAKEFKENGGEAAAFTFIRQGMWYRAFKALKFENDLQAIFQKIFNSQGDNEKIELINNLEKINKERKNGLTGKNGNILNAILFVQNPEKYISSVSLRHRMAIVDELGLGDTSKYKSFGEQIIYSNRDIINGFREKFNIEAFPRMISHFTYRPFLRAIWEASFSEKPEDADEVSHEVLPEQDFYIEKHLEDFLIANWERTPLSTKYDLIEEDGELKSQQYKTDIGYIDLLVRDKTNNMYVVIELKKGQTSDDTVGQLSRYMGWVKKNLAQDNGVKGIVIAGNSDAKLKYALSTIPNVSMLLYKINFDLKELEEQDKSNK